MSNYVIPFLSLLIIGTVSAAPRENSFVVSSTESSGNGEKEVTSSDGVIQGPIIYEMDIISNVSNRFAKTLVVSKVKNIEKSAKETTFTVVLPEKAFISEFIMEIGGKSYKAYVKEKEEAKQIYDQAVSSGQSAGHVAVSARDSNKFTVSVNVEPESKVVFLLTYEELLERRNDQYELILNIRPGQIVKDLNVKVQINETRPIKFVKTPSLRSGNEITKNDDKLDPSADIQQINSTAAIVTFNPDSEKQKQFARDLGDKEADGLSGQFIVQYDVERDPHGGEVLLQDGYFVHFFSPENIEPLPKHVLFVLDSSGSMAGEKIEQVREAMHSILNELREGDVMSILDFGGDVNVWDIAAENTTFIGPDEIENFEKPFAKLSEQQLPTPISVNKDTVEKAKRLTDKLSAAGGTNMISGLEVALYLSKLIQDRNDKGKYQPVMIFLTDGEPNVGIRSTEEITKIVTRLNTENNNVPIFSLSFGRGADKEFLRKLSSKNQGFSRHIYEASDASLQLQEFYKQISSPLLSNIVFKYNDDAKHITRTKFPIYFRGSEIVVAGRYNGSDSSFNLPEDVTGWGVGGRKNLRPVVEKPATSLERLWAYLTVKQTLEERELSDDKKELTKKALDLALKYSFVTDITSLVVVKPNETSSVNTENAANEGRDYGRTYSIGARPFAAPGPPVYSTAARGPFKRHGLTTFGKSGHSDINQRYYTTTPRWDASGGRPLIVGNDYVSVTNYITVISISIPDSITSTTTQKPSTARPLTNDSTSTTRRTTTVDLGSTRPVVIESSTESPSYTTFGRPLGPSMTQRLKDKLPWLADILMPNLTVTLEQGTFQLGKYDVSDPEPCPRIPTTTNATQAGECVHLKNCPEVYSLLTDLQTYQQYFCLIENTFAGICCPNNATSWY